MCASSAPFLALVLSLWCTVCLLRYTSSGDGSSRSDFSYLTVNKYLSSKKHSIRYSYFFLVMRFDHKGIVCLQPPGPTAHLSLEVFHPTTNSEFCSAGACVYLLATLSLSQVLLSLLLLREYDVIFQEQSYLYHIHSSHRRLSLNNGSSTTVVNYGKSVSSNVDDTSAHHIIIICFSNNNTPTTNTDVASIIVVSSKRS